MVRWNSRTTKNDLVKELAASGTKVSACKFKLALHLHGLKGYRAQGRSSCSETGIANHWIFQQDCDSKHSSRIVIKWLKDKNANVMELTSQRPDLNSTKNWWNALKTFDRARRPTNLTKLYQYCPKAWAMIPAEDF